MTQSAFRIQLLGQHREQLHSLGVRTIYFTSYQDNNLSSVDEVIFNYITAGLALTPVYVAIYLTHTSDHYFLAPILPFQYRRPLLPNDSITIAAGDIRYNSLGSL